MLQQPDISGDKKLGRGSSSEKAQFIVQAKLMARQNELAHADWVAKYARRFRRLLENDADFRALVEKDADEALAEIQRRLDAIGEH